MIRSGTCGWDSIACGFNQYHVARQAPNFQPMTGELLAKEIAPNFNYAVPPTAEWMRETDVRRCAVAKKMTVVTYNPQNVSNEVTIFKPKGLDASKAPVVYLYNIPNVHFQVCLVEVSSFLFFFSVFFF
jgi:hypothetical protein